MKLKNLKLAPFQIAGELAANETIVRLIYDDEPNVLENKKSIQKTAQQLINEDYIGFYPATESGISTIDKNTFIIINMEDFGFNDSDSNVRGSGAIYITTDKAHAQLTNGRLRLLELADAIEGHLNNKKLSSAGKIRVTSANYVVFSDFRSGYRINFSINDQQREKAEL